MENTINKTQSNLYRKIRKKYHAVPPLNESGTVFWFGICHQELGFRNVFFHNSFPDATAYYLTTSKRVKIEFEFRSSNFFIHKHEIGKVDLIICWKHDAYHLIKPVLELSTNLLYYLTSEDTIKILNPQNTKHQSLIKEFLKGD